MSKRSKTDVKYAIDLLWTHQVRRENTFLHKEIQRLQEQIISAPTDLKAVQQTASAAQKSAETTSSILDHFRQNLQELKQGHYEAAKRIEDITEQVGLLESRIDIVKKHQEQSTASLTSASQHLTSQIQISVEHHNRRLSSLDTKITGLKHGLEGVVKSSELRALEDRVGQLKEQIQSLVGCQSSPGRVIDSLEERIHRGVADAQPLSPHPSVLDPYSLRNDERFKRSAGLPSFLASQDKLTRPPPARKPVPREQQNLAKELMLGLQPEPESQESVVSEDFDLDEDVETMSYARTMGRDTKLNDSLATLRQQDSIPPVTSSELRALSQGHFHSWERYFAEGEDLFRRLPREHEFSLVKTFLEGLYNTGQKRQFRQWLDLTGWTWRSVASFAYSSTPAVSGTLKGQEEVASDATRVPSPAKVHFLEPEQVVQDQTCEPAERQASRITQPRVKPPLENEGKRRSQRLIELEHAPQQKNTPAVAKQPPTATFKKPAALVRQSARVNRPSQTGSRKPGADAVITGKAQARGKSGKPPSKSTTWTAKQGTAKKKELSKPQPTDEEPSSNDRVSARQRNLNTLQSNASSKPSVNAQQQQAYIPNTPTRPRAQEIRGMLPVPRLVKRKTAVPHAPEDSEEEITLPRMPQQQAVAVKGPPKRRKLPLPPPPAIPILPTSDD